MEKMVEDLKIDDHLSSLLSYPDPVESLIGFKDLQSLRDGKE